ncbi:MAG: TrmB family transcriptional regulator [Anaerolineales bacterium]|nr:TrmB family transcriptional regulator [Chloroflexota bacterium]MBL6981529.1 TrmB family transcriptional regulator [Anaerolineales bacterium]
MEFLTGLTRMGFTEYEAKVYLALLHENPATGYQLSKKSGVPRSMVYEALGRLSVRGAVLETIEGRATLYRPLPPDVLLDRYEEEQRQLTAGLREGLDDLYTASDEDSVWSISGRQPTLSYAAQLIRSAREDLYMVLTDDDLDILNQEIVDAHERGVKLNTLLTGETELDYGRVAHHPPLESEKQELTDTLMIVVDDAKVLIASTNHGTVATITSNRNLVLISRQFVWMELFAQRISARLGTETINKLDPEDQKIFSGHHKE